MNRFTITGRLAVTLSGLAGALLAVSAGAAPAAFAKVAEPLGGDPHGRPGWSKHLPLPAHARQAAAGGMSGWQVALIVAGAALLAAVLAVIACQMRTARRRAAASTA